MTEGPKDLFYRKADKFLLKIGDKNNYFNPDASGDNKNWKWLKTYAENVIEEMSKNKRELIITDDNNPRYLTEIKYYINRYIFENDTNIADLYETIQGERSYMIVYDHLKKILEENFLKIDTKNKNYITKIELVDKVEKDNIDRFFSKNIIVINDDDISVNKTNLVSLNKELNEFNYNYKEDKKNNFIDINFSNTNYIYAGKDKDIKLLNIGNNSYQDFLINENITQEPVLQDLSEGTSTNRKLKDLILSIKNRHNMIHIQEGEINVYQGYMTRGVFFYYKTILDVLVKKLKGKVDIDPKDYKFLPISISIMIYDIIFKNIYNTMTDDEVINFKELNNGQNDMSKFATLFYVEMKPFLDQYKACDSTQKVKFFCNINDNEGALNKYGDNNIMNSIKKKIPIETSSETKRVFSIKEPKGDPVNYDTLTIDINTLEKEDNNTKECESFNVYFNKVFDKTKPQVMAPYIAASNVINNYEGLMLFTFGYSGVGKSFTIFGGGDTPGVLSSIFSSIQNVDDVTVKIYEIYGMGLNKIDNFNNNVYHKYVNHKIDDNNSITESTVVDKINDIPGQEINIRDLPKFLKKLNSINDEIEDRRGKIKPNINYSVGSLKDGEINIKTIKKTKNNPDSSRSILCYELIINKDDKKIPFIIVDLPGKEIIKDSFGEEGEALLKINLNSKINDEFLNNNFSNILKNIQTLSPKDTDDIFEGIDIEPEKKIKDIKVKYSILQDTTGTSGLPFKIKLLQDAEVNINKNNIQIESTSNNDIENLILYIPNLLILKQKHNKVTDNKIILPLNGIGSTFKDKLYLGFNKNYSRFIKEITINDYNNPKNDNIKFKLTLNLNINFKPYIQHASLNFANLKGEIDKALLNDTESTNVSYYSILVSELQKLKQQSNIESNKVKLIKAMNDAVNYSKPKEPKELKGPHPILKLTQILDRINDKNYIEDYKNNAEKCFRYTKSAEGIFINENINGIMQLMINKKGLGNNMTLMSADYEESKMFYNTKLDINPSFNKTLIYDNLYKQYEENQGLQNIDNMYAFFVVANISKNERIKQKLICNAKRDTNGNYPSKNEVGWECDEEALAKEKEEALIQQKGEIEKDRVAKKDTKKKGINAKKEELKTLNNSVISRIKKNDPPISIKNYFDKNENLAKIFLEEFNKKNIKLSSDQYISKLAEALYNETENKELRKITDDIPKKDVSKKDVSNVFDDIIQNFNQLDTDNNGSIDISEFKSAINRQLPKKKIDDNMIQLMFNEIDTDRSGFITLKEFETDMKKQSGQGGGGADRKLYIREMCKTQIALFRELQSTINTIVNPDN